MRILLFCLLLLCDLPFAFSQTGQLSGRVLDARTREPLPFASVFISNTTIATHANDKGEFVLHQIPVGNQEFVTSFIGYQSYQTKVVITEGNGSPVVIHLLPTEGQLTEVEIKESRDKVWEKNLRKFEKVFIGEGSSLKCRIVNPWVIDFSEEGKTLLAQASLPIEIVNENLGYRFFYYLKEFKYTGGTYSIIGQANFEEIPAKNAMEAWQWKKNREQVYAGSVRHLMKSILDKKIRSEGFRLYSDKIKNAARSTYFSYELAHNIIPFDTTAIVSSGGLPNEFRIAIKDKIEVHQIYAQSKSDFYKDVSNALSWIEVRGGYVKVNKEGALLNSKDVIISGDMSIARMSQMLPLNYLPGIIPVIAQPSSALSAKRLRETPYIMTDKPYYYAGESIWLSAFMKYQSPSLVDTLSKVLYVDLINEKGAPVKSLVLKMDSARAVGHLRLPEQLPPGNYVLSGYTQWMKNYGEEQFFYKSIPVLNILEKVDVSKTDTTQSTIDSDRLKLITDKAIYGTRQKVTLTLRQPESEDSSSVISLAVSVTDVHQVIPIHESVTISKEYSVKSDSPVKSMLSLFIFPVEKMLSFEGEIIGKKKKADKSQITFVQNNFERVYQVTTGIDGRFSFSPLPFYDSARFGIQVTNGSVKWKYKISPHFTPPVFSKLHLVVTNVPQRKFSPYEINKDAILLKEVEVKSTRETKYENPGGKTDVYVKGEDLAVSSSNLASALVSRIPGYKLIFYSTNWFLIRERGEFTRAEGKPAEPVLFIDNNLVVTGMNDTVGDRLNAMNTSLIDHIEVNGMINSQMGANGSNGAIYVYTKRAESEEFKSIPIATLRGFDHTTPFQAPDYGSFSDQSVSDERSTLYWNPKVNVGASPSLLSFYTSDLPGKYKITMEGMTDKGMPIRGECYFVVAN